MTTLPPISICISHLSPPKPFLQTSPFPGLHSVFPAVTNIQKNVENASLIEKGSISGDESTNSINSKNTIDLEQWKISSDVRISSHQPSFDPSLQYFSLIPGFSIQENSSTVSLLSKINSSHGLYQNLSNPPSTSQLPGSYLSSLFSTLHKYQNSIKFLTLNSGQQFRCSLSIFNGSSSHTISNVTIHLELLVQKSGNIGQNFTMKKLKANQLPSGTVLLPKSYASEITNFLLNEPGINVLSCLVTGDLNIGPPSSNVTSPISPSTKQSFTIRKIFPFIVVTPISVKDLRVRHLPFSLDQYRISFLLYNISPQPLQLQKISFNLKHPNRYIVKEYSTDGTSSIQPLKVGEIRNIFFDIISKESSQQNYNENNQNIEEATTTDTHPLENEELGTIGIAWISEINEQGQLITPNIQKPKIKQDSQLTKFPLHIELISPKEPIIAEKSFTAIYKITNQSFSNMNLTLRFDPLLAFPMILRGKTIQEIGELSVNESKNFSIEIIPMNPGQHRLGNGISLIDKLTNKPYYFGVSQTNGFNFDISSSKLCDRHLLVLSPQKS